MAKLRSAGLLVYRRVDGGVEVLLGHMGGPFWARKDRHAWSIPKGECEPGEEPLAAARREFEEEIGQPAPAGEPFALGEVVQGGGRKIVTAWAVEGDLDVSAIVSTTFEMEWPRGSGELREFPEFDHAAWTPLDAARERMIRAQAAFLDRLLERIGSQPQ
ncbi:MAG: NUDIX domain-containing protein [Solirubrobacterales bacterium]|nr:NUDIX domain-containing protein [Solirubrobacterales bacterium]